MTHLPGPVRRALHSVPALLLTAFLLAPLRAQEEFSFLQFSDSHVDAHLLRTGKSGAVRGEESIRWLCEQAGEEQELAPYGVRAPRPAFALGTGDLTEFGVIDDTWECFERAFQKLPCPLHVTPGNHDHTWVAMTPVMRRRHGGPCYSFDHGGCHFIALCSATLQEPVPGFDGGTLAWLARDLEKTPPSTPLFLFFHHPPDDRSMAQPATIDTLVDLLGGHNVALLLYGHGHRAVHRVIQGLDGVMGGSTYGPRAGYVLVHMKGDVLRVVYRHHDEALGTIPLLEKRIARRAPARLFEIESASPGAKGMLRVALAQPARSKLEYDLRIDGEKAAIARRSGEHAFVLRARDLAPGMHLLSVRASAPDGKRDLRTRTFHRDAPRIRVSWRRSHPAAYKAAPLLWKGLLILAGTDGVVRALDPASGEERWRYEAGAEIVGTPVASGDTLVLGDGAGVLHALDPGGVRRWSRRFSPEERAIPLYASLAVHAGLILAADNGGCVHAASIQDGAERWCFERADYAIECGPILAKGRLVFGAWDGYLYGLGAQDGSLCWKSPGPRASEGKAMRYYAPADCAPVALGGRLFACDRGYELGVYSEDGELEQRLLSGVAAIAAGSEGRSLYARGTDDRVLRLDAQGKVLWTAEVAAGRFPVPPTELAGELSICSNRGLLQVLKASSGKLLWSYQATAGFHVMAAVAVDGEGTRYVAGMDGSVVAVRCGK